MNIEKPSSSELQEISRQHALVVRTAKVSFSLVLLMLAGACIGVVLWVPTAASLIRDILPGSAVPTATQFVLGHANAFAFSTLVFTVAGLFILFARPQPIAMTIATVLMFLLFAQWQFIVLALQLPLVHLAHALAR